MIALIPAAGKGARMASVTGGAPKELLALGSRSVLDRIIDEAKSAGVTEIVVINSPNKPGIDDFATQNGLGVVVQPEPRGLGHAVAQAPVSDVLILLGDTVYRGGAPSRALAEAIGGWDGAVAVEPIPDAEVSQYGIVEFVAGGRIHRMLEKPNPAETSSRFAVAARYAFSARFMGFAKAYIDRPEVRSQPKEISLTQIMVAAMYEGMTMIAIQIEPHMERVDCGSAEEYLAAKSLAWS